MVKIVENPGNGRLNNLNDPVLNVLIILTPVKILQRNLNRSTFVVWEMWHQHMLEVATICVQTGLKAARHILESPYRVISKGLWPPRSPDLTPPDYFLWGYLKGTVCQNKPQTIDALKANITEKIQAVTADVLARTFQYMARRFSPVWTQIVATSSICYDVVKFLTQRTYSCSNFVVISLLVLELLKKCRVR